MPEALSLERYAELIARMTSGEKRGVVLESAQIDLETWDSSQQYWLEKMATEVGRARYSLAERYGVLLKAAQSRLDGTAGRPMRRLPPRRKRQVVVHAMPEAPKAAPSAPSAVAASPAPGGPMAPPPTVAAYAARLSLELLAAMQAEIATAPGGGRDAVLQRFGLDTTAWEKEEAHWQRQLARDQDLFNRYLRQFQYSR